MKKRILSINKATLAFLLLSITCPLAPAQESEKSNPDLRFYVPDIESKFERAHSSTRPIFRNRSAMDEHGITEIGLQRTPCYGTCPSYTATIFSDGSVRYNGKGHVDRLGYHTCKIGEHWFHRLASQIIELGFSDLAPAYSTAVSDSSTVFTSVLTHGERKIIKDYASAGPENLIAIELLIDSVVSTVRWDDQPSIEQDVLPKFIRGLESADKSLRLEMVFALAELRGPIDARVAALTRTLRDLDPDIRLAVLQALWTIGSEATDAVPAIINTLKYENAEVRASAARTLARIGMDIGDDVSVLANLIADENESVRANAATALGNQLSNARAAIPALLLALNDLDIAIQKNTITSLSKIAPATPEFYEYLLELLENGSLSRNANKDRGFPSLRIVILEALGRIGPGAVTALPNLVGALSDPDSNIRHRAAQALGNIGPAASAAADQLVEVLDDDATWVAAQSLEALQKILPDQREILPILFPLIRQKHQLSTRALNALSKFAPISEEIFTEISRATRHEDFEIRASAVEALGTIGVDDRSALPLVAERLENEAGRVRAFTATALSQIAPKEEETIDALINLLTDDDWFVRSRSVWALKGIGNEAERAISPLFRLLNDENENVRSTAYQAIESIQAKSSK